WRSALSQRPNRPRARKPGRQLDELCGGRKRPPFSLERIPPMTTTLHTLARQMSLAFESGTRTTSGETFRKLKDGSPEWMTTVCRKAHDDARLLPDDCRYAFIEQAVDALANHEDTDDARSSLEPDIY